MLIVKFSEQDLKCEDKAGEQDVKNADKLTKSESTCPQDLSF